MSSGKFSDRVPVKSFVIVTLLFLIPGVIWSLVDTTFLVSFAGSATGTAVGGMAAAGFAIWIWRQQAEQAIRERSLLGGRAVARSVAEIFAVAQPSPTAAGRSSFGAFSGDDWDRIKRHFRDAEHAAATIETPSLREPLVKLLGYITWVPHEHQALEAVSNYRIRAVKVHGAVRNLVEAFQKGSDLPSDLISGSDQLDMALVEASDKQRGLINELLTRVRDTETD